MVTQFPVENDITTETQEVDKNGGWIVTHHTRTWDTRMLISEVQEIKDAAKAQLDRAQEYYDKAAAALDAATDAVTP
jgi:hypothetical protein